MRNNNKKNQYIREIFDIEYDILNKQIKWFHKIDEIKKELSEEEFFEFIQVLESSKNEVWDFNVKKSVVNSKKRDLEQAIQTYLNTTIIKMVGEIDE